MKSLYPKYHGFKPISALHGALGIASESRAEEGDGQPWPVRWDAGHHADDKRQEVNRSYVEMMRIFVKNI